MKKVLCFGASNTYGYMPFDFRYGEEIRWPCRVAAALGAEWQLVEAGLNGRTIGRYHYLYPEKNGVDVLASYLRREAPLDWLVIMLGSNDTVCAAVAEIGENMARLLDIAQAEPAYAPRRLLLLGPTAMANEDKVNGVTARMNSGFQQLAQARGVDYADTNSWQIELSMDGCHFSPAGHQRFGEKMTELLLRLS